MISRDDEGADLSRKQEINGNSKSKSKSKAGSSSSTLSASWSRFKDPRIVRVSKAFGGKDRHSKVCTVRGLRDRRVRLSVPTAIQLYDLQDRLGLNQPSKVVDWLLNVAKNEIDGLPPLQIPQGMLDPILPSPHHHHFINNAASEKHGLKMITTHGDFNWKNDDPLKLQDASAAETSERNHDHDHDDEEHDQSWTRSEEDHEFSLDDHDQNQGDHHHHDQYVSTTSNFLPRQTNNPSPMPPYNSSFVRWDPSNLTLSHQPQLMSLGLSADHQNEDLQSFSLVQLPSTLSVYQHGIMNTQPYFPSQISTSQPSAFHTSSHHHLSVNSSTQPLRPFHFSMAADLLPSQNNAGDEQNKRD